MKEGNVIEIKDGSKWRILMPYLVRQKDGTVWHLAKEESDKESVMWAWIIQKKIEGVVTYTMQGYCGYLIHALSLMWDGWVSVNMVQAKVTKFKDLVRIFVESMDVFKNVAKLLGKDASIQYAQEFDVFLKRVRVEPKTSIIDTPQDVVEKKTPEKPKTVGKPRRARLNRRKRIRKTPVRKMTNGRQRKIT